jgi:hypothetical protein
MDVWQPAASARKKRPDDDKEEDPMCPACIATAALIVTKASSAGGLTALVAKKLHAGKSAKRVRLRREPSERRPR